MWTLLTSNSDFVYWNSLRDFAGSTGIAGFFADWAESAAMIPGAFFLLYGHQATSSSRCCCTIAFGMLLTNLPDANLYHTSSSPAVMCRTSSSPMPDCSTTSTGVKLVSIPV